MYTDRMMKEDDLIPGGTLKRTVVLGEEDKVAYIKILIKIGFSWRDLDIGVEVRGYAFEMRDPNGNLLMEAHPP